MIRIVSYLLLLSAAGAVAILVGKLLDASTVMHGWGHSVTFVLGVWSAPLVSALLKRQNSP